MPEYLLPGVFVEELAHLPPVVVDSAVPAGLGYTAQAAQQNRRFASGGTAHPVARRVRDPIWPRQRRVSSAGGCRQSKVFSSQPAWR